MVAFLISVLSLGLITGCGKDQKKEMFTAAENIYQHIALGNFDQLPGLLDEESRTFYEAITDKTNLNFDSIYTIGQEQELPYTTLNFLMDYGRHMRKTEQAHDFFYFPVFENISYFNIDGIYQIEENEYQLGRDLKVGMSREVGDQKSLTWMHLTKEGTAYKLNIMPNLALAEYRYYQYYKDAREKAKDLSVREWLWAIYDQTGENRINIRNLNQRLKEKEEKYIELKGTK